MHMVVLRSRGWWCSDNLIVYFRPFVSLGKTVDMLLRFRVCRLGIGEFNLCLVGRHTHMPILV